MNKKILLIITSICLLIGLTVPAAIMLLKSVNNDTPTTPEIRGPREEIVELDNIMLLGSFDKTRPFFENEYIDIDVETGESVNKFYDTLPELNNETNFQSLGGNTYANINGKTVTADAFYRVKNESASDPNVGVGLMLFQCIQYKIANPEEDVKIAFSTYRFSVTASVCVNPESRYYGYMRSLYTGNYDNNGFVRIAFMLAEAARMGIEVTIVGQLDSYAVKQYNSAGKLVKVAEPSYKDYFAEALASDCYDKYAEGKKVSDYMSFHPVEWSLADKGGTDMMHLKCLAVSHYLDTKGTEHGPAVWFSSSNLDANDYRGCNGNNGSQSGVIVSDHDKIFEITYNYIKLMAAYDGQEELYELRHLLGERNMEQVEMILAGREDEIPEGEQIVYMGSETDNVFELHFTPISALADDWDTVINPFCRYTEKLFNSEDYIIFAWNNPTYDNEFFVSRTMNEMIVEAFMTNRNIKNRITIKMYVFDVTKLYTLKVGEDLGFKLLTTNSGVHNKDLMFSYAENGERHYVSLLTSCNFHSGALYYQTNSILVIDETDQTGNGFFEALGVKSSSGAIVAD